MLKILWLCSWYPNDVAPFEGDFVQRHAQAASLLNDIHVIKLTPVSDAKGVSKITRTFQQWENLTETFIYYPKSHSLIGKTVSYFRWYSLFKFAVENYIEKKGKPDLIHVHIPYKAGIIAKMIKRKYHIPFVVTEHWDGYNNIVENNYAQRDISFRNTIKDTLKSAAALHSVSDYLAEQMNQLVIKKPYTVFPNVVNTNYFNYAPQKNTENKFRLVHISNGVAKKNPAGIIDAFKQLNPEEFSFTIIGFPEEQNRLLQKMYPFINFTGAIANKEVASYLQNADALIIFSDSENSPCVIGEALCCGLPVIATKVGGISELIHEDNGLLIAPRNVQELIEAIHQMRSNYQQYHKAQIAAVALEKFSYEQIAIETDLFYTTTLLAIKHNL
jgi:glycosyltransferase involved in cell wall biosynthesis